MRRLIVGSLLLCGWATSALAQFSDKTITVGRQNEPDAGAFATISMLAGAALPPYPAHFPISVVRSTLRSG